ncbi:MAG: hypothetical protein IT369_20675 [Candidatus Latescibacteria bacterium]|nr:hypothetical protein [Candidatus Latescibacterota bacterium]
MRAILFAALCCWFGCEEKSSTAPLDEPLNTQTHTESDVSWDGDRVIARGITWNFLSLQPGAKGDPVSVGKFGFTLINNDRLDRRVSYDLHFVDANSRQLAVALYPYVPVDSLPLIKHDSLLTVTGFFQTSSIPSAAVANSITRMKLFATFFAP